MSGIAFEPIIEESRWGFVEDDPDCTDFLARISRAIIAEHGKLPQSVQASVLFANDTRIQDLNRNFREIDKPTNVLSFESGESEPDPDSGKLYIGDIAISYETVQREADEAGISLSDHLAHMVVHGTLHLCGFDHLNDDEAEQMETLEIKILETLGISDPYAQE